MWRNATRWVIAADVNPELAAGVDPERLHAPDVIERAGEEEIDPDDPANWLSLDYIHDQVQQLHKAQSDLWYAVDGRLRLILGVIGIVFAASATFQRQVTAGGTAQIPFALGGWYPWPWCSSSWQG